MKKIFIFMLCLSLIFAGCNKIDYHLEEPDFTGVTDEDTSQKSEFCGLWLTYSELSVKGKSYTEETYSEYIGEIFDRARECGITDIFVHARAFADALYFSSVFPHSEYASGKRGEKADFDILNICIKQGRQSGIRIHAWINPYRISSAFSADYLCEGTIKSWYEENTGDVFEANGGLYLNPSSEKAKKLVTDAVREILKSYDVAGIHFDDYFYPENCKDADRKSYEEYKSKGGKLTAEAFRKENVSSLISNVYTVVKSFGKDKIFSISPTGDIEKNLNSLYADVSLWCKGGYCDMIIPQLYYGFQNETMPFENTLDRWLELCENSPVKLVPGLALYKKGKEDAFAGNGRYEWIESDSVINRQIEMLREKNICGYALFSASYLKN